MAELIAACPATDPARPGVEWCRHEPDPAAVEHLVAGLHAEISTMDDPELRQLFHKLNNQLGIILSHAELLEAKSPDDINRSRASLVVASVLDAMGTTREIRLRTLTPAFAAVPPVRQQPERQS